MLPQSKAVGKATSLQLRPYSQYSLLKLGVTPGGGADLIKHQLGGQNLAGFLAETLSVPVTPRAILVRLDRHRILK